MASRTWRMANWLLATIIVIAPAVGDREHERRHHEQQMHADQPGEPAWFEYGIEVHERLEHLDRRDRDDRCEQLLFQAAELDLGHPVRPVGMAAGIDLRHEIGR